MGVSNTRSNVEDAEKFELPLSGGFIVPLGQLDAALSAMNERWCVVKIGGKMVCSPELMPG